MDRSGKIPATRVILLLMALVVVKGVFFASLTPAWQGDDETAYWADIREMAGEDSSFMGKTSTIHGRVYPVLAERIYSLTGSLQTPTRLFIIRLIGVLFLAGVVFLTYRIAEQLWPESLFIPIAAPLLVAFNPKLSFLTASVSPDVLLVFIFTFFLFLLTRVILRPTIIDLLLLVLTLVIGTLTKNRFYIAFPLALAPILTLVPALVKKITAVEAERRQRLLLAAALAMIILWQTGGRIAVFLIEKTAMLVTESVGPLSKATTALHPESAMLVAEKVGSMSKATISLDPQIIALFLRPTFPMLLFRQYWGFFTWRAGIYLSEPIYQILLIVTLAAMVGLALGAYQALRSRVLPAGDQPGANRQGVTFNIKSFTSEEYRRALAVLLHFLAIGLIMVAVGAYQIYGSGALGRYLLTAAAPIAIVMAVGLDALLPEKFKRTALMIMAVGFFSLNIVSITAFMMPRFY